MSKRFKVRQRNAAKQQHSREITAQFYGNVIAEIERLKSMPTEVSERLFEAAKIEIP